MVSKGPGAGTSDRPPVAAKWAILGAVMLGSIMGPLDGSIVNTVLPSITSHFHTEIAISQWVPTIYLLTISCLILLYGRLGDMIGYRAVFLWGLSAFTVTSVLCVAEAHRFSGWRGLASVALSLLVLAVPIGLVGMAVVQLAR